jgi:hypothetical protein
MQSAGGRRSGRSLGSDAVPLMLGDVSRAKADDADIERGPAVAGHRCL